MQSMKKRSRKRRVRKKINRKKIVRGVRVWLKRIFTAVLVVGVLGSTYYWIFRSDVFRLNKFQVIGTAKYVNSVDLKNFLDANYMGENLIFLETSKVEHLLEDIFLGAQDIDVKKKWPNELIVKVTERKPLAVLYNDTYSDNYMVDQEGYVLGIVDSSAEDLPEVNYIGELKIGSFVQKDLIPVYTELIKAFDVSDVKVSSVSFHPRYVSFYSEDGVKVLIDNKKDKFNALNVLSRLLHKLTLEGKSPSTIDLRYDKVVVSY